MFKEFYFEERFVGYVFETRERFFFFGARGFTRKDLPRAFPKFEFGFLKQTHSATVVRADTSKEPEADALFTSQPNLAVVAQSADCVPILLSSHDTVCAIHSGWRGCAQNIVLSVATRLPSFDPELAAVGPHIQKPSFEVGADVAESLDKASPTGVSFAHPLITGKKLYDLNALVWAQIAKCFPKADLKLCLHDTKTDNRFCSFRRDGREAGRQYSFVVIKGEKPD